MSLTNGEHCLELPGGLLRAWYATAGSPDADDIWRYAAGAAAFSERHMTALAMVLEDKGWNIGLLAHVQVDAALRGQGIGAALLRRYAEEIMPHTDVDIVFASVELPQRPGFTLQKFYGALGFEPVMLSSGDLLMASQGKAAELREDLRPARPHPGELAFG